MTVRTWLSGSIAAGVLALSAAGAAADCKQIAGDVRTALSAGATERYAVLFDAIGKDPTCDPAYRQQVGRAMARSLLTTLSTDSGPGGIDAALHFGRPWQVLVALGDAYYDRQDWANAADAYTEALTDMAGAAPNPTPLQEKTAERLQRRALQARALAPEADLFASRAFQPQTAAEELSASKNPGADAAPVLALFESGSAELTRVAMASIKLAYGRLAMTAPNRLTIIGHSDPTEAADLAERRAKAVTAYLIDLGYAGTIEPIGKGSSQPFAADEPEKFTEAQRHAFDRRVEYQAGG